MEPPNTRTPIHHIISNALNPKAPGQTQLHNILRALEASGHLKKRPDDGDTKAIAEEIEHDNREDRQAIAGPSLAHRIYHRLKHAGAVE